MGKKRPKYLDFLTMDAIKNIVDGEGNSFRESDGNGPYYIEKSFRSIRDAVAKEQFERVMTAFEISYDENGMKDVQNRFLQAVTGAGNEWMEINQLNSSALLSFLCFHAVGIDGRTIKIDGTTYNKVKFEFKSPLNGSSSPSWMDVVFLNENSKKALFLESKFTEYTKQTTRPLKISSYYNLRYEKVFGNTNIDLGDDSHTHFEDNSWKADSPVYLEGVKQMICHFLGIIDQIVMPVKNDKGKYKDDSWGELTDYEEIVLGEIVYDFKNEASTSYKDTYKALSSFLNNCVEKHEKHCGLKKKIIVLKDLLTYQEVFEANANACLLKNSVGEFYGLK